MNFFLLGASARFQSEFFSISMSAQPGRRQVSGYAEGRTTVRWLHQLPTAECVQIRRRRDQAGRLVPALLPEDLVVGLKMQLKLHPKWAFSIIRTDGSGY
jgi:hypothetical protein